MKINLTDRELKAVRLCLRGEVENDDGYHGDYMRALTRVLNKLDAALRDKP